MVYDKVYKYNVLRHFSVILIYMPRNTTSRVFFYTYVLESLSDGKL